MKKRPKALRWKFNNGLVREATSAELHQFPAGNWLVIGGPVFAGRASTAGISTKSQCRKLIAWLEKAKEFLK